MHVTLYFGTKREADWDNFHKLSCDALNGIAYDDDSQIRKVDGRARVRQAEAPHRDRGRAAVASRRMSNRSRALSPQAALLS
jgi:hypothetical protein